MFSILRKETLCRPKDVCSSKDFNAWVINKPTKVFDMTGIYMEDEIGHRTFFGEKCILGDLCTNLTEHFCGALHLPNQNKDKLTAKPGHGSITNILVPCGVKSFQIMEHQVTCNSFRRCICGNSVATDIRSTMEATFITYCQHDHLEVMLDGFDQEVCPSCNVPKRYVRSMNGFAKQVVCKLPMCINCMFYKDTVRCLVKAGTSINDKKYKSFREKFHDYSREKNDGIRSLRTLNNPNIAFMINNVELSDDYVPSYQNIIASRKLYNQITVFRSGYSINNDLWYLTIKKSYGTTTFFNKKPDELRKELREYLDKTF
uniref:Non-structural protein 1 n=1 Tax=Ruddy turnstone rotavirus TaxID=2212774 RepID=A0A3G1RPF4_9REOV|nr:MAG: non-structural protein 1 [Ruddy turnstone rotavirus]